MAEEPAASPSRPSVRLTAFDQAVMRKFAHRTNRTSPTPTPAKARSRLVSRAKERRVEAGVSPLRSAKNRAVAAKVMPMNAWPSIFCHARRPNDRSLEIFSKSSRKPMSPRPTMRKSSRTPLARGARSSTRLATA